MFFNFKSNCGQSHSLNKICIVISTYNEDITQELLKSAKKELNKLGNNKLVFTLDKSFKKVPAVLNRYAYKISKNKSCIEFFLSKEKNEVSDILLSIKKSKMDYLDFNIEKRSLESIFVDFIKKEKND